MRLYRTKPNRIGVTTCRIVSVNGRSLEVVGLDAVDGTPVVDLKPTVIEFLPADVRQPAWVGQLMADYFSRDLAVRCDTGSTGFLVARAQPIQIVLPSGR